MKRLGWRYAGIKDIKNSTRKIGLCATLFGVTVAEPANQGAGV